MLFFCCMNKLISCHLDDMHTNAPTCAIIHIYPVLDDLLSVPLFFFFPLLQPPPSLPPPSLLTRRWCPPSETFTPSDTWPTAGDGRGQSEYGGRRRHGNKRTGRRRQSAICGRFPCSSAAVLDSTSLCDPRQDLRDHGVRYGCSPPLLAPGGEPRLGRC